MFIEWWVVLSVPVPVDQPLNLAVVCLSSQGLLITATSHLGEECEGKRAGVDNSAPRPTSVWTSASHKSGHLKFSICWFEELCNKVYETKPAGTTGPYIP